MKYVPGKLEVKDYKSGKEIITRKVETTGNSVRLKLTPHRLVIKADKN